MEIASFVKSLADRYRYGIDCIIDNNDLLALALSKMPTPCIEPMESCNDATNTNTVTTITCDGGNITLDSEVINTVNTITQINVFGKGIIIANPELKTNKTFRANVIGKGIITKPNLDRTSGQTTVTDIDSNTYNFITIGDYDWFTTNLKTIRLNDGTSITLHDTPNENPYINDNEYNLHEWSNNSNQYPYYSWYDDDSNNKNIIGALYSKAAALNNKICPIGWRVPTYDELKSMIDNNNSRIRSTSLWSVTPNVFNSNGFNLIPNGYKIRPFLDNADVLSIHNAKYFDKLNVASIWTTSQVIQLDSLNIIPLRPNIDFPTAIPGNTTTLYSDITRGAYDINLIWTPFYFPNGNCIRCMRDKF